MRQDHTPHRQINLIHSHNYPQHYIFVSSLGINFPFIIDICSLEDTAPFAGTLLPTPLGPPMIKFTKNNKIIALQKNNNVVKIILMSHQILLLLYNYIL